MYVRYFIYLTNHFHWFCSPKVNWRHKFFFQNDLLHTSKYFQFSDSNHREARGRNVTDHEIIE